MAEVKKAHVEMLPIPFADNNTQDKIALIVDNIMTQKCNGENTDDLEGKIDQELYKILNLTKEEITVIEKFC